jgi:UPF0755 protein
MPVFGGKRKRRGRAGRWARRGLLGAALLVVLLWAGAYAVLWAPNTFDGERIITVSKGDTFRQIEDTLIVSGVVRSGFLFNMAARFRGSTRKMQIGRYRFRSGMSNVEILEDLEYGTSVELVSVTLPEGYPTRRIPRLLNKALGLDTASVRSLISDSGFIRSLGIGAPTLEGYLLPNTYRFTWQESDTFVITTLVGSFRRFFNDSLRAAAASRGMSVHEVLTLASIIQAETRVDSERARISGVYHNRLRKRMRLQADPTIQYILEDGPRRITYADLNRTSPYNTYRNSGLPPGPINNPGMASILAALNPEKHRYYFFVASGGGGHTFTRTYAEHLKEVRSYRKRRQAAAKEGG